MTTMLSTLVHWLLRTLLLVAGVLFFLGLLCVVFLGAAVWLLRALWARLTGRAVSPWQMRVDPRAGFGRVYQNAAPRQQPEPAPSRRGPVLPGAASVSDVQAREVHKP